MPFCSYCGAQLDDGAKFCGSCGASVSQPAPSNSVESYDNQWQADSAQYAKETARKYLETQNSLSRNYLLGFIGALAGGLIGAIPWAIVSSFGWFVGWLGFLIAFLASKGYDLMKVKQNMNKLWCVIIAVIIGVFAGQILSDIISIVMDDELNGEFLTIFNYYKTHFVEYLKVNAANLGMGYLFAALGSFSVIRDIRNEHKRLKEMKEKVNGTLEY
ncbi:MAG: zinc ribbon domain-containing protein [Eubacterium sp.]|nr:zinc ribbon domain-containing protein [Eubacterium sp.]